MRWLAVALLCVGCGRSGLRDLADGGGQALDRVDGGGVGAKSCSGKITFTQAEGCLNDGALELCATDDAATEAELAKVVPGVYRVGTPGRSRCLPPKTAYLWPLAPGHCVSYHGAMTDEAWAAVCALAVQPQVSQVSAWWAE
ncbi:MAG: hypothetical protein AMXMBFR34_22020 [Myxococcaceae bacterium]